MVNLTLFTLRNTSPENDTSGIFSTSLKVLLISAKSDSTPQPQLSVLKVDGWYSWHA